MYSLDSTSDNHYVTPIFSYSNKIKRLIWIIVWKSLCKYSPTPFHGWRVYILRLWGAKLGKSNHIYPSCKIWAPWLLKTEDQATIGPGVEIYNPGGVFIGEKAIVSQNAYICGATHDFNSENFTYISKPIVIKKFAWICARAIVLPGVTCDEGSILGAGSVTSKDLNKWSVYAGNPCVFKKSRNRFNK